MNNYITRIKLELMRVFNEISKEFDVTRRKPWSEVYLVAKRSSLIVDLGCGSGRNSIAAIKEGCEVIGVDLSREMLKLTSTKAKKIKRNYMLHTLNCDLSHLAIKSNSIDSAICLATLHHIPTFKERVKALKEISRILKPKGKLVVSVWAKYQPRFLKKLPKMVWNYITGRVREFGDIYVPWRTGRGTFPRFYHLFSRREIVRTVEAAKLKIIKVYGKSFKSKVFDENHLVIAIKNV